MQAAVAECFAVMAEQHGGITVGDMQESTFVVVAPLQPPSVQCGPGPEGSGSDMHGG